MIQINPVAFSIGLLHVRWYGVMAALGLLVGYVVAMCRSRRYGLKKNDVADMVFWAMLTGVIGARILHVISYWEDEFAANPMDMFKIYRGGLVFYGGFIGATLAVLGLCLLRKIPLRKAVDVMAPALAIGHAFGRLGCLLNGCCFGKGFEGPCAFRYAYPPHPVFPIQFFFALFDACLCLFLLWLERKGKCQGRLCLVYLVLYSIGRFLLEFGRGDYYPEEYWLGLSPAQAICVFLLPAALAVYFLLPKVLRRVRDLK